MSLVVLFVKTHFCGNGYSILTSSIVLAIMILPMLTNVISTAVLMLLGNASLFPHSLLSMSRTLTMNIVTDMSYAEGVHMNVLFATSLLLLIIILLLNSLTIYISHKVRKKNE